jgi:hypothetical protein
MNNKPLIELSFTEKLIMSINQAYNKTYNESNFIKWDIMSKKLKRERKNNQIVYRIRGYYILIDPYMKIESQNKNKL